MRLEIELRCILFPLIILEMFLQLDWSPPVLNSTGPCLERHTPVYIGPTVDIACQSKNQAMRLKELSVELRDRLRSWEDYQKIATALKVPKNTVASIILTWKKFGTTKTLPRAGHPAKLSNWWRRALVRKVSKNTMVTMTELKSSSVEMGELSRRTV